MTGDWAGGVQVVRSGHVEGREVRVVVLNNIQLSTHIKIYPRYFKLFYISCHTVWPNLISAATL